MKSSLRFVVEGRAPRAVGVVAAALVISACTTSSLDTVATGLGPAPAADTGTVMALSDGDGLPAPDVRPAAPVGATAPAANGATVAFAGPTPTAPAPSQAPQASVTPPAQIAAVPATDATPTPAIEAASTATAQAATPPPVATPSAPAADDVATQRILAATNAPTANGAEAQPAQAEVAVAPPPAITAPAASSENRPGILNALFGSRRDSQGRPRPLVATASNRDAPAPVIEQPAEPRPVIARASASGSTAALPGFSRDRALGINQNAPASDAPVQLASAAGLARLTPNGLRTQHSGVDVACLKPALVRLLKRVEQRYGKPVVVTSGYRSPQRNRRARGAKNSLHMYCAAADIQVAGVSKWDLAAYLRSVPGRGGVGTYCHTKSVHIDIGPKRDWNWRCRRRG
ncbi:MAG: D-Ala-D-Ala carboxypeptidase family metallohydrolase [Phyllobacteriaceae bacterium]|nr:D-Ala-D-Ala carboxypeptidase family metallohydrolase [Phyllobacteriaceae bacterium]